MTKKRPSMPEYLLAIRKDWGASMSGSFALYWQIAVGLLALVILGAVGLAAAIADEIKTRLAFEVLGLVALLVALYNVWARERNDCCDLEEQLMPGLDLTFDRNDDGFLHVAPAFVGGQHIGEILMVRVLPNCNAPSVRDVSGAINGIHKLTAGKWEPTKYNESLPLSWSVIDTIDPINIIRDKRQFLNVMLVSPHKISIYPTDNNRPARAQDVFNFNDTFRVDVLISSAQGDSARASIQIRVGADWRNPEVLELIDVGDQMANAGRKELS